MIKILKLASYLSIALAISTVVFAGIGITRENSTFSERAEFLDTPTVVEILREQKDNLPKTEKDKTSPLVTQAIAFALRIDPPPPPPPPTPRDPKNNTNKLIPSVITKAKEDIIRPTSSKLIATCRYEKFPEKSLALLDVTSEGHKWLREGDMLGPKTIHRIEDGKIVLRQGNQETVLYVPKDNTIKSLLKGSGDNVMATVSPTTGSGSTVQPGRYGTTPTSGRTTSRTVTRTAGRTTGYTPTYRTGRTVRKRPAQPPTEEARKAAERNNAEIKGILDDMSKKKDSSAEDRMKAIMKMIETMSKKKEAPAKTPPGKDPPKKGSSK